MTRSPILQHLSLAVLYQATATAAYSWYFQNPPEQCGMVNVNITGDDGRPPYRILIVPSGPSPLPNAVEARRILDIPFDDNANSVSFRLPYPENSQFIAVVSDANGFGSGGTSVTAQVSGSDDDSCFDKENGVQIQWWFSITPENQIVQCSDTRIHWEPSAPRGNPTFQGVIPGGQSFTIPQGSLSQIQGQGTGFTWNANLRTGTTLFLVGSDDRGFGSGGSVSNVVSAGINPNSSCINSTSPSSTGSPAGGTYPTGSTTPSSDSGGGSNTGAIVGGVVGGVIALLALLLLLFFLRRRKNERLRHRRDKPLDLLKEGEEEEGDGDGSGDRTSRNDLPQFYQPEPFTVPDPTIAGSVAGDTDSITGSRRPMSSATGTSFYTSNHGGRPGTPDGSVVPGGGASNSGYGGYGTGGRKGAPPRVMRPVNIIQHDDAGPSYAGPPKDEEAETIELPPAYTALRGPSTPASGEGQPAKTPTPPAVQNS